MLLACGESGGDSRILPVTESNIDSLLNSKKDKIVLVNLWATWCPPCVEEFPAIVKISNDHSSNVEVVFISLDQREDIFKTTRPFLKNNKVFFTTYYNSFGKDENLISYFDKDWDGAIPATFIYKNGKIEKKIYGMTTYEEFDGEIKNLLKR